MEAENNEKTAEALSHEYGVSFHFFDSTREAYDAANEDDEVNIGDILVVQSEGVVGLAWAYPVAVTEKYGEFHHVENGSHADVFADAKFDLATVQVAIKVASGYGYPLAEWVNVMNGNAPSFSEHQDEKEPSKKQGSWPRM